MNENLLVKLRIGGIIFSMFIAAGSWILDIAEVPFVVDWRWATLFAMMLFFILVWWHIWILDRALNSNTPHIVVTRKEGIPNPFANEPEMQYNRPTQFTESGRLSQRKKSKMVHVLFSNEPEKPTKLNDAIKVRAELTYYDTMDKRLLGPINGRWGDSKEPGQLTPDQRMEILFMNFPSNGAECNLDVAMRYPDDQECYAYNNESYFAPNGSFKKPEYKLEGEKFYVRIVLKGAIFKEKVFWFTLHNNAEEHTLSLLEGKDA